MKEQKRFPFLNYLPPVIMIALGLRHFIKHGMDLWTIIPIALGIFALYLAVFNHRLLQRILESLTKLWNPIGRFIALFLLTVTFFIVFMPVGLILRLFKKDILNRKFKTNRLSYWLDRSTDQHNDYTQQF